MGLVRVLLGILSSLEVTGGAYWSISLLEVTRPSIGW